MIANYYPKVNLREKKYLVIFPEEFGLDEMFIKNFKRPETKQQVIPVYGFRKVEYVQGRIEFEDMEIKVHGVKSIELLGELDPHKHTKFDYTIEVLDKTNIVLEEWKFKDCFVHKYNINYFQDEEYDADQVVATLTITSNLVKLEDY